MIDRPADANANNDDAPVSPLPIRVTRVTPIVAGGIAVRVDPHNGVCEGAHDIVIEAMPVYTTQDPAERPHLHVSLAWQASIFLSIRGTQEFAGGLAVALQIARQLEADGEYREYRPS